jgi:hypothetical protein
MSGLILIQNYHVLLLRHQPEGSENQKFSLSQTHTQGAFSPQCSADSQGQAASKDFTWGSLAPKAEVLGGT